MWHSMQFRIDPKIRGRLPVWLTEPNMISTFRAIHRTTKFYGRLFSTEKANVFTNLTKCKEHKDIVIASASALGAFVSPAGDELIRKGVSIIADTLNMNTQGLYMALGYNRTTAALWEQGKDRSFECPMAHLILLCSGLLHVPERYAAYVAYKRFIQQVHLKAKTPLTLNELSALPPHVQLYGKFPYSDETVISTSKENTPNIVRDMPRNEILWAPFFLVPPAAITEGKSETATFPIIYSRTVLEPNDRVHNSKESTTS